MINKEYQFDKTILDYLKKLPHDGEPEFTSLISNEVIKYTANQEEKLIDILKTHADLDIRFRAFYSLMVYYRRYKIQNKMEEIVRLYGNQFKEKPLFLYQMSIIYRNKGELNDLKIALQYSRDSIKAINNNERYSGNYGGFYHNFAEIVAISLENDKNLGQEVLEEAFSNINRAIIINLDYPKYYCTLGRLLTCKGDYVNAKKNILKAIELEDNSKHDYAVRISEYQDYLIKCYTIESLNKMNSMIEDNVKDLNNIKFGLQRDLQDQKNSILEFIGFFAAIITFIISSVQISVNLIFKDAVSFILVMLGALILAFGTLRVILNFDKKAFLATIIFGVVGLIIISAGILLKYFL